MADRQYDNEKTGVLFKNDRKNSEKQPDYNGNCTIEGVEYDIAGWIKEGKQSGKKFISFKFQPKDRDGVDQRPRNERQAAPPPQADEIPF